MIIEQYSSEKDKESIIKKYEQENIYTLTEDIIDRNKKFLKFRLKSEILKERIEKERLKLLKKNLQEDALWNTVNIATSSEIDNWIDSNITDLSSAKQLFKRIVKMMIYLNKKINGEII